MVRNFVNTFDANLVGLWDFLRCQSDRDTGLDDGIAQNGIKVGGARAHGDQLVTDGQNDRFDVPADACGVSDDPFDLAAGSIVTRFTASALGGGDATVVSRGIAAQAATKGFFEIRVTGDGAVQVFHAGGGAQSLLSTDAGFLAAGETAKVTYSWSETAGPQVRVENETAGTEAQVSGDTLGLGMAMDLGGGQSFVIAAQEGAQGCYGQYFKGTIDYVAVLDQPVLMPPSDGIVSGTPGDDFMDYAYTGDPDGDMIDDGIPSVPGGGPNDDIVKGYGGDDTILSGLGDDLVYGGQGDDTILGGVGDDVLHGDSGNDTVSGGDGHDTLWGGSGNDALEGGAGHDILDGGSGDDTVSGGAGNDALYGGDGDDTLEGGAGHDLLIGWTGDDRIDLGSDGDADIAFGGQGSDVFTGIGARDAIDGNEDADGLDNDVLDLTGAAQSVNPGGSLTVDYSPANSENGIVSFFDAAGNRTGTARFYNIETVIPCFTPGTVIATPRGEVPVEDLRVGERVITRDNGIQEIRWVGARELGGGHGPLAPHMQPVLVRRGALGNGLPLRDMLLSPNHRVLVANDRTALYFEDHEVLVAVKHLVGLEGVERAAVDSITYIHFMFDRHEVVLSDGAWTESFQPGDQSLRGIGSAQRNEIYELFPELRSRAGLAAYAAARRSLRKHEARLLM